jgi:PAS domain S-box-containing protein
MKSRIGFKLVMALVLFSSFITLVTTALQLYFDYRIDIDRINNYDALIRKSYLKSITTSVWLFDERQINIQLKGILNLPDMAHIQIQSAEGTDWSVGTIPPKNTLTKTFSLLYTHKDAIADIGTLSAVVSLENIYTRLFRKAFAILLSNAVKTFLVSGFILMIFQYLITRHLNSLSLWLKDLDIGRSFDRFHLNRRRSPSGKTDELDEVVIAINEMQDNLKTYLNDLIKSENNYRTIFENAVVGVYQSTPEGKFITVNPAFARIFGYDSPEEVMDKISDIATQFYVDPADRTRYQEKLQKFGKMENFEYKALCKDGSEIWISNSTRANIAPNGKIIRYDGMLTDITGRKRAEEEKDKLKARLQQAQKMETIGTLAGGIAHDFNNILGIIIGNMELALDDLPQWTPARVFLEEIKTAGMRAKDLVRQLLSFSRKTEQNMTSPIHIGEIFEESVRLLRASTPSYIEISAEVDRNLSLINADPTQIQQVIINLATNAIHAMEDAPGVLGLHIKEIELTETTFKGYKPLPAGAYIQLTISDTGHGVDPAIFDKIFDPYFTTKEVGKGTGMGLSVVHGIVSSHDGALTLYSEPGKGSVFRILFPTVKAVPVRKPELETDIPEGVGHILFVDDEASLVRLAVHMLEKLGYTVTAFTNPSDALDFFTKTPDAIDLVITDMTMPELTGEILAQRLTEIREDLPVILCTGFSARLDQEGAPPSGIKKIIEKPVNARILAKTVEEVLKPDQSMECR